MIKLLKYNFKRQSLKNIFIIIIIGIIMPLTVKGILNVPNEGNIGLKDIFIEIYGGINISDDISIMKVLMFLTPHLSIIFLLETYFTDLINNTPRNMFLRIRCLKRWSLSLNISLLYAVIKYYLILYCTSIITILVYLPKKDSNIIKLSIINLNDITMILQIIVLSIITIYSIILIANNLYFICNKEDLAIVVFILINITTILFSKLGEKINTLILMNHMIIKRHSIFQDGYSSLTFKFSIIYIGLIIIINLILNVLLVKKQDY